MRILRSNPSTDRVGNSTWTAFKTHFDVDSVGRRRAYLNRSLLVLVPLIASAGIVASLWLSLVFTLLYRLEPRSPRNGLQEIVEHWNGPRSTITSLTSWLDDFSRDIRPIPCHSHNDYWRRVPLFEALYAGCTSVEADIWLDENETNLFVGHAVKSLRPDRTLQNLYLHPLSTILTNRNMPSEISVGDAPPSPVVGVFDSSPDTSLILLLDIKTNGTLLWPLLHQQLEPLRQKGWLSYWDGHNRSFNSKPVTVVATGNAPFDMITADSTHRDIFYDAPLNDVQNDEYTSENSYYASISMHNSVGYPRFGHFSNRQIKSIKSQINSATDKGLRARYWDTPDWPISVRNRVWSILLQNGVGVLNVDDLVEASRWNWDWCIVAGLVLCGRP